MAKVLVTKHITPEHLKLIMDAELKYDIALAVQFEINYDTNEVIGAIKNSHDWIFTSVNAVKSINMILAKYQKKFEQKIYCVGKPTFEHLTKLGYFSVTKFDTEKALRKEMDWQSEKSYTYFCNNTRKKLIPQNVKHASSVIEHVEVYKTILKYPLVPQTDFDYIFFFSPMSVKSIFKKNPKLKKAHAICAGPATINVVKDLGVKNYSLADLPNMQSMVKKVLEF